MKNLILWFCIIIMNCYSLLQAQTDWTESGTPVLYLGQTGDWDAGTVFFQSVIKVGDTRKMWYTGSNVSQITGTNLNIGYAQSVDGINWVKYSSNPVVMQRPDKWDSLGVATPVVVQDDDTLRMWYSTISIGASGFLPGRLIGYAVSVDGINWTRLDTPVLEAGMSGEWDDKILLPGAVIKEGNTFKMWYSGGTGTFPNPGILRTGYATSTDGIHWLKYDDPSTGNPPFQFSDPVLPVGSPGNFDDIRAWTPDVHKIASGYEMFYAGEDNATRFQDIGYATSTDGIQWIKYRHNPIIEAPNTWTNDIINPRVISDDDQYHMWFTGFSTPFPFPGQIGYATAPITTSVDEKDLQGDPPAKFLLHQNFPNPFNSRTVISYQLPYGVEVELSIYNLLGQKIRTLVNEIQIAGNYTVVWDSKDKSGQEVTTGVYIFRLKIDNQAKSLKMVLLQ